MKILKLAGFAIALILVGVILMAIAGFFGFRFWDGGIDVFGINYSWNSAWDGAWSDSQDIVVYGGDSDEDRVTFERVEINVSAGRFKIEGGETFSLLGRGIMEEYLDYSYDGSILIVTYNPRQRTGSSFNFFNLFGRRKFDFGEIMITVPSNDTLEVIDLKLRAGDLNISGLNTETLFVDMSAGRVEMAEVSAYTKANITMSAGLLTYRDGNMYNLNASLTAGQLNINRGVISNGSFEMTMGDISVSNSAIIGDNSIAMKAGSVSMGLDGNIEDYNISASRTAGSVSVSGSGRSYSDNVNVKNPDAPHSFAINVTAGSCNINFN